MDLRLATSADVPLIAQMNRELMQDEGHADVLDLGPLEDRMRGWLAGEYRAVLFEQGGEVVAYALLRPEGSDTYLRQFFSRRQRTLRSRSTARRATAPATPGCSCRSRTRRTWTRGAHPWGCHLWPSTENR